ncbi:MAG: glycoside hydrolase [Candidatus Marinimicrobia bacterium]|nr:glycoside hydrolase [Candidatus Neomarinimicrobiota bacterium]
MKIINKLALILLTFLKLCFPSNLIEVLDLKGTWKFCVGDDMAFAQLTCQDQDWDKIHVPDSWEDDGFPGYDGYCWYRFAFTFSEDWGTKNLVLLLGAVDDVDEVYFNNKLIGALGNFPPAYRSAYDEQRIYSVPEELLNIGKKNVIAVRVYDHGGPGGIIRGKEIGIYQTTDKKSFWSINLSGTWKFRPGNEKEWADEKYNDNHWDEIIIPGAWDDHGYADYDGFAWYRKDFVVENVEPQHLVLLAGKIDDFETIYINGSKVGSTMPVFQEGYPVEQNHEWQKQREYYIHRSRIHWGRKNTIAIQVYDGYEFGGIREGKIKLLTRDEYKLTQELDNYNFNEIIEMIFE